MTPDASATSVTELLPCPFCGKPPSYQECSMYGSPHHLIRCCGVSIGKRTFAESAGAWNTRTAARVEKDWPYDATIVAEKIMSQLGVSVAEGGRDAGVDPRRDQIAYYIGCAMDAYRNGNPTPTMSGTLERMASAGNTAEAVAWECANCGQRNAAWATECGNCECSRADVGHPVIQPGTITVCSRNEPDGPPWCAVAKWDAERRCYVTIDPMYAHPAQDGAAGYREPTLEDAAALGRKLNDSDIFVHANESNDVLRALQSIGAVIPLAASRNEQEAGG